MLRNVEAGWLKEGNPHDFPSYQHCKVKSLINDVLKNRLRANNVYLKSIPLNKTYLFVILLQSTYRGKKSTQVLQQQKKNTPRQQCSVNEQQTEYTNTAPSYNNQHNLYIL